MRVAQLDRATGYGPVGRGFESFHARNYQSLELILKAFFICAWEFEPRVRVYVSLRSAQDKGPPDLLSPFTHVIIKALSINSRLFSCADSKAHACRQFIYRCLGMAIIRIQGGALSVKEIFDGEQCFTR